MTRQSGQKYFLKIYDTCSKYVKLEASPISVRGMADFDKTFKYLCQSVHIEQAPVRTHFKKV